jgi:hypothetical protein
MQHSSRKVPCPVCSRCKDDKCRWSATRIYCYVGDSFSPPLNLRIGDKIKIAGEQWKLFSCNAGFSQNSYAFALHEEEDYRFLSNEDKRLFRKNCIRLTRIFLQKEKTVNSMLMKLSKNQDLCAMTPETFYANKSMAKQVNMYLTDFADFSFTNKRYLVDSGVDVNYPRTLAKESQEVLDAIYEFERNFLGNATPEQNDLRPVAFVF